MAERARARLVHVLPGRIRLRVPAQRGDIAFFRDLSLALMELPGVTEVTARHATAGVLIRHEGPTADLLDGLAPCLELEAMEAEAARPLLEALLREGTLADLAMRRLTGGRLDAGTAAAVVLFALAGLQAARGQVLGPAVTLAIQALGLLRQR